MGHGMLWSGHKSWWNSLTNPLDLTLFTLCNSLPRVVDTGIECTECTPILRSDSAETGLLKIADAVSLVTVAGRLCRAMESMDFCVLLAVLTVLSQPESLMGALFQINSFLVTGNTVPLRLSASSRLEITIAGIVSGMETAYCLSHSNDKLSILEKVGSNVYAFYWTLTEPNYRCCAYLSASLGTWMYFVANKLRFRELIGDTLRKNRERTRLQVASDSD